MLTGPPFPPIAPPINLQPSPSLRMNYPVVFAPPLSIPHPPHTLKKDFKRALHSPNNRIIFTALASVKLLMGGLLSGTGGALLFGIPFKYSIGLESILSAVETLEISTIFAYKKRHDYSTAPVSSQQVKVLSAVVSGSNVLLASALSLMKSKQLKSSSKTSKGLLKNWKWLQGLRKKPTRLLGVGVLLGLSMGYLEGYLAEKIAKLVYQRNKKGA